MPKKRGHPTLRKQWDLQNMELAIYEVRDKQMEFLKAARTFGVPRSILFWLAAETSSKPNVQHQSHW